MPHKQSLGPAALTKLTVSYNDMQGVQMTTRKKLCTIKGISEAKMEKIKEACTKIAGVSDLSLIYKRSFLLLLHVGNVSVAQLCSLRSLMARCQPFLHTVSWRNEGTMINLAPHCDLSFKPRSWHCNVHLPGT